jgi:tetratricopeptide (TPR) repeat protein
MSVTSAVCIGKICVAGAKILGALHSDAPQEHLKDIFEALGSGGEAADKLRGSEMQTFGKALESSRKTMEQVYDQALKNNHSAGFADTVDQAFANLAEVFETCVPRGQQLAKLNHDPESIGNFIADAAVARQIDAFREGEGRKLLVALVVLAYTALDSKPEFMTALQRVNWKEAFEQFGDIKSDTAAIRGQQLADSANLKKLLALAEQGGAFQRASEEGIPEAAVRAIVERLGGEGIGQKDLLPWLDSWIETARQELGRRTNEDEAFEAARLEAERRFKVGRSDASAALMNEYNRERRAEADRQEQRKRRGINLLELAIRFDELQLNAEGVVSKLHELAGVEGRTSADDIGRFLFDRAVEFHERGDRKGENPALLMAITTYRAVLKEHTRERVPLDWAATQNDLGNALSMLGERESGTARLEEAATAYRAALQETTRDRAPLQWATTQNNLGNVLQALGERESTTARLEEAVTAYRMALEEFARERAQPNWAAAQNNLGNALRALGERATGTARLEESVTAYRAALQERTRERVPLDWAMTQTNLGNALSALGARESGKARLEEAVAAYRAALQEGTRERVPLGWAMTQNNLGVVLQTLGERERGTTRLGEAVAAFRAALQERTRERVPPDWAMTQNNLGVALSLLGARETGTARLEEAVVAIRAALQEHTLERVPPDWAMTQNNLGIALSILGARETGTVRLEEAVAAFRAALQERPRERVPLQWERTTRNLERALQILSERQGK